MQVTLRPSSVVEAITGWAHNSVSRRDMGFRVLVGAAIYCVNWRERNNRIFTLVTALCNLFRPTLADVHFLTSLLPEGARGKTTGLLPRPGELEDSARRRLPLMARRTLWTYTRRSDHRKRATGRPFVVLFLLTLPMLAYIL